MALQIRRGTDAQRQGITSLAGELIPTTDTKKLSLEMVPTVGGVQVDTTLSITVFECTSNITPRCAQHKRFRNTQVRLGEQYILTVLLQQVK